ncbi:hypothetical protein [Nocardia sp. XZ_19_369]|uniref:hypothetical protein n=1 Tax=Nocardia sp. XZ_19_369 TaxID=2769487 RepID=UPI0018902B9E|nr:hypothetical protein [Nocardia sp. XZ_19_369]
MQELQWANRELWDTYGSDVPLPQGAVVLVPQLCGYEILQRTGTGPALTCCERTLDGQGQAHVSKKVGDARKKLLKTHNARLKTEAVRSNSAPARGLVLVPELDDAVVEEEAPRDTAESPVEPSVVEVAEVSAVDALEAVRGELAAARRLADDSAARVTRAEARFSVLAAAVARERAELKRRYVDAEKQAAAARRELEDSSAAVAAAELAQRHAEGRAEELSEQLAAARRGELQEVVESALDRLGSRRGAAAGKRTSPSQRDMILRIGSGRTQFIRDVVKGLWFADGEPVVNGPVKTLDSLLKRKWVGGWSEDDEFAAVQLVGGGVDYYRELTGSEPSVVASVDAVAAEDAGLDEAPDADASVAEDWEPFPSAVADLLRRVRVGGVTRTDNREWRFTGDLTPPRPAIQTLNWMLAHDRIHEGDGGSVHVTEGVEGG